MITTLIFSLLGTIGTFVVGLLPASVPDQTSAPMQSALGNIFGYAARMGAWIPWSALGAAIAAILAVFALGVIVHFTRMILSLFTGGGGSVS